MLEVGLGDVHELILRGRGFLSGEEAAPHEKIPGVHPANRHVGHTNVQIPAVVVLIIGGEFAEVTARLLGACGVVMQPR